MRDILPHIRTALEDKFATDVTILDIAEISSLGDYFIIATGKNENQIQAMAQSVAEYMHTQNMPIKHHEGGYATGWALLDYGSIIIHIFNEENREFYNLERIWSDAKEIK